MDSLAVLNHGLRQFLDQGDQRVKDWPFMQSPFPGITMIAAYIYFVKVAGPQFMKKRKPYDLRTTMTVYNFAMVFCNLWIFLGIGWYGWFSGYSLKCQPVDYSNNYTAVRMAEMGWWFYAIKFVEFADTIFFVLRKKDSQISALHVIHHSIVPFSLWFGIKFAPGGYNAMFPFINSLVHVIMYSYYGVAALGERYKKYLFWKKYMTYIQMSQFVGVMVYAISLAVNRCDISRTFIMMNFFHALLFLGLFFNFFLKSYSKKQSSRSSNCSHSVQKPTIVQDDHKADPMRFMTNGEGIANQKSKMNGHAKHLKSTHHNGQSCSCNCTLNSLCASAVSSRNSSSVRSRASIKCVKS